MPPPWSRTTALPSRLRKVNAPGALNRTPFTYAGPVTAASVPPVANVTAVSPSLSVGVELPSQFVLSSVRTFAPPPPDHVAERPAGTGASGTEIVPLPEIVTPGIGFAAE